MTRNSPIYNYAAALADACAADYELYLLERAARAEEACRGRLVNARGRAQGVTSEQLLRGVGHHMKRAAYGTEELREHLTAEPILTRTAFEQQWLDAHIGDGVQGNRTVTTPARAQIAPLCNEMVTAHLAGTSQDLGTFGQTFPVGLRARVMDHWENLPKSTQPFSTACGKRS